MALSRRNFVKYGASLGGSAMGYGMTKRYPDGLSGPEFDRDDVSATIAAAIDTALKSGAEYVDVRITHSERMVCQPGPDWFAGSYVPRRQAFLAIGVRSLIDGFWGFASSPICSIPEAHRLGKAASENAKVNFAGQGKRQNQFDLSKKVDSGSWTMPVKLDPFEMAFEEIVDYGNGLYRYMGRLAATDAVRIEFWFFRQDKWFGSSLNQNTHQRTYNSSGFIQARINDRQLGGNIYTVPLLSPAGAGAEYIIRKGMRETIELAHEDAMKDLKLSVLPVEPGRYETIINGLGVAQLMSSTLGLAAEADRIMGYESNDGGTSFITEPDEMLGNLKVGSSILNVNAGRNGENSVNRIMWDDEGVKPQEYALVEKGIIRNLHTNKEAVGWTKSSTKNGHEQNLSRGCSYASEATDSQLIRMPDINVESGSEGVRLNDLRKNIKKGIELRFLDSVKSLKGVDFQLASGLISMEGLNEQNAIVYEIRNGERFSRIGGSGLLFRTLELWSNVMSLGDESTRQTMGFSTVKGQPKQTSYHSTSGPACLFKDLTYIDRFRKA